MGNEGVDHDTTAREDREGRMTMTLRVPICDSDKAMEWYKSLSVDQRINLKELCPIICGMDFQWLGVLFTLDERIALLHRKLQIEGILS